MTRAHNSQRPTPDAKRTDAVSGPLPRGWLPIGLVPLDEDRHEVEWLDMSGLRFSEPFFTQTLARVRDERPDARAIVTGIEELLRAEGAASGLEPSGFIFHTSRCGSTLVSNALKSFDGSIVVAEAPAIDSILGLFFDEGGGRAREMLRLALLRAAIKSMGQKLCGDERRYFVKFTNWSILHRRQIARLWPTVPWLFLYRNPVEVIVSNIEKDAGWMRIEEKPDEAMLLNGAGSKDEAAQMSREEHCARVIGRCCEAAASTLDENGLLVNYAQLGFEKLVEITAFFGVTPSEREMEGLRRVSGLYSKDPARAFAADSESKRAAATELIREMAERWAAGPYEHLEQLRTRTRVS